jgi:hypothetical protein
MTQHNERHIRHQLAQLGYQLRKSRSRNPDAGEFGRYATADPEVAGGTAHAWAAMGNLRAHAR